MNSQTHLDQLGTLAWLKWRLFRNAMRKRRGAAVGAAASAVGTLLAVGLALLVSVGIGFASYALAGETAPTHTVAMRGGDVTPMLLLFGLVTLVYVMWSLVPLSMGGGSQFDPGALLLYPISLRTLFLIDLLSELASLASIFAVPSILAVGVGAGIAGGDVSRGVVASVAAAFFGVALAKLFSTAITSLMRRRRARGETLLALIGVVAGFSGVLAQIGLRAAEGARTFPQWLRWTPPGALVAALTTGLNRGGAQTYALALATLAFYACAATWLTYRIAVRALNSSGGVARSRATLAALPRAVVREGWRLPIVAAEVSTVFEKELRYAARNAQLRMMVLMPVVITVAMRFGMSSRGMNGAASFTPGVAPFIEGSRAALGIFYVFAVTSSITANCFGYDGAGMRAFVLSPVARRAILAGKNLAMLAVVLFSATLVTVVNQIAYGGLSLRATTFAALAFLFNAGLFFAVGNFFSVRFPRRMQFGKRVKASGTTGLLLVLFFLLAGVVPALAIIVGWLAGSVVIEYVILAAFACAAVVSYFLLLDGQGRDLARRELDILEAVAKHDD